MNIKAFFQRVFLGKVACPSCGGPAQMAVGKWKSDVKVVTITCDQCSRKHMVKTIRYRG